MSWKQGRPLVVMAASGPLALEVIMLAIHATGMDVGPALTNLALIAMTATVLWKRAHEVRQAPGPAARQRSEQTFT